MFRSSHSPMAERPRWTRTNNATYLVVRDTLCREANMSEFERRIKGLATRLSQWFSSSAKSARQRRGGSTEGLRREATARAQKAASKLSDLRESERAQRAASALHDLRESETAKRAEAALHDLRVSDAGKKAESAL